MASKPQKNVLRGDMKEVTLTDVRPNTFNYNRQSEFVFEKMLESLKTYGFVDPLIVRSANEKGKLGFYEIIGGEHRFKAAEQLEYTNVPIIDLGKVPDREAKKLCIILNETRGKADHDALSALIAELGNDNLEDLSTLPFDESELKAFMDSANAEWEDDANGDIEDVPPATAEKKTLISLMGLVDISKKKEDYLISRFEKALELTGTAGRPIRCIEKMLDLVDEAYS